MKKRIIAPISALLLTIAFTLYSETVAEATVASLRTVACNIIPSLFPYMVISSLIISSGAADILGRMIPISRAIGVPDCGSASIIIGALCGFPLGSISAVEMYEKGYISKQEAEVLLSSSNVTGPSFIIFVIGAMLWKSKSFGIFMYISQLITVFISGIIVNRLIFPFNTSFAKASPNTTQAPFLPSISQAVKNASISSLTVCGYITFFSVLINLMKNILSSAPYSITLFVSSIMEFSHTAYLTAEMPNVYGAFICGFAVGWSGLSVLCQTASFTSKYDLSLKRYIAVKLMEGTLLGICCSIYVNFKAPLLTAEKVEVFNRSLNNHGYMILTVLIIFYSVCAIKKKKYA